MKFLYGFLAALMLFTAGPALAADSKIAVLEMGSAKIFALSDVKGTIELNAMLTPEGMEQAKAVIPDGKMEFYLNVYVIKTPDSVILIDAGVGQAHGGRLVDCLAEAGIEPEEVNLVLLTHLHIDHCGGLFYENKPLFPNADIWVSQAEADYWGKSGEFPASQQGSVNFARQTLASPRLKVYEPGQALLSGLTSLPAYGHTPGHTAFRFNVGGKTLLIGGYIIHIPSLQFFRPEISVLYDVDSKMAIATRKRLLAEAYAEKQIIAGMHLAFPGWGLLEKPADEQGIKYEFVPLADK